MADDSESGSLTVLSIVAGVVSIAFVWFEIAALDSEPSATLFGLGGLCTGALIASVIHMTRQRWRACRPIEVLDAVDALAQRMGNYEAAQERVTEIEDRLDFAERLLAQDRSAEKLDVGGRPL